jgi:hypothetical protein
MMLKVDSIKGIIMYQMKWIVVILVFTGLIIAACGNNAAQEIFDTAKLEELQNNPEHALTLYQEIIKKYPSSPLAPQAQERIKALKKNP